MDFHAKIRTLPTSAGVYLYKNAEGEVIYVGKAKNLKARVRSYFVEGAGEDAKTGSLLREAVDVDYIVVDNEREALALENNLIKQKKPRFNILLRDDKTYPYVKLTLSERFPRVYVTRRLRKDGGAYYGPYFPTSLAYRIVDLIHRNFLIPSCKIDLSRYHPRPCLQFYIGRCLGPCVEGLTTPERYAEAVRDVKLFLEGKHGDLSKSLRGRMEGAAEQQQYELASKYRDLISTVEQLHEKQRMAMVEGDDADVFGYHFENNMLAMNLFHMRGGRVLDRREFFWEDLPETVNQSAVLSSQSVIEQNQSAIVSPQSAGEQNQSAVVSPQSAGEQNQSAVLSPQSAVEQNQSAVRSPQSAREQNQSAVGSPQSTEEHSAVSTQHSASEEDCHSEHGDALPQNDCHPEPAPQARVEGSGFSRNSKLEIRNFNPAAFFASLLPQIYIGQQYVPRSIYVPVDFPDRDLLQVVLSERREGKVEIVIPQRGEKRSLVDLVGKNAKQSFDQRFRVLKPATKQIQEALQDSLDLPDLPKRIECFDISHIQGAETVASMVVWEEGKMNKSAYRKFIIRTVVGVDDFASMREVVTRRYKRIQEEKGAMPSLILIDGGIGQLHSAADALAGLQIINQSLAAIAKREEIIYVYGQESEPILLDRHSPVLHLIQTIRDEAHRFAVTFHRKRRQMRDRSSELLEIPGIGVRTRRRLVEHFGSVRAVEQADPAALSAVVTRPQAEAILSYFRK